MPFTDQEEARQEQESSLAAALIDAVLSREPIPCHPILKSPPLPPSEGRRRRLDRTPSKAVMGSSGICLEWQDLSYCVPSASGPKPLLQGIWGSVQGGEMSALMGASGAG